MTSKDLLRINLDKNIQLINKNLKDLLKTETKNVANNSKQLIKCGLWLNRLYYQGKKLEEQIKDNHIPSNVAISATDPAINDKNITIYDKLLSNTLLTEIKDEQKLANNGKFNKAILHYIAKGIKLGIKSWFN